MSELTAEAIREMVEKATAMGAFRAVREAAPDIAAQALRWHDELTAARARIAALEEALRDIKWRSVDRDNMEFGAKITCFQMDAIRAALHEAGDAGAG